MYNIAICDDDIHFISYIKKMLLQSGLNKDDTAFFEYCSGESFLRTLEQFTTIDLLILDMQIPDMNGNEIAASFRQSFPDSILVFCSGVCLPTVKSFETNPFRYLLKEYSDDKIMQELSVILEEVKKKKVEPCITGTWHYNTIKLRPSEILYISIGRNCSLIHTNPAFHKYEFENNITCKQKLHELYRLLKDYDFEFAHNSYLVNLQYIKRKTMTELELTDGTVLSISRSKEKALRLALVKYSSRKY